MSVYRFILACAVVLPVGVCWGTETSSFFLPSTEGGFSESQRAAENTAFNTLKAGKPKTDAVTAPGDTRRFLQRIVAEGLEYSSEIKNAQAGAAASRYDVERVKGERYPQVTLSTSSPLAGRSGGRSRGGPGDSSATLSATTTLYDFGHRSSRIQGGEETVRAAEEETRQVRNQIAAEIVVSIATIDRFHHALDVAHEYETRMKRLTGMLDEITQADTGRKSELVQARSRLLQAQTHVRQIESHLDETVLRLQRLTGKKVEPGKSLDWGSLGNIPLADVLKVLDKHPSLEKSRAQIRAIRHEVDAAKSARLPSINWSVSRSIDRTTSDEWYTGVNLEWNVFTGGSASASVSAASQRVQAAEMDYETTLHELQYRIRELARSRDASARKAEEYQALSVENEKIREMFYDQWYNLGSRTLLDVLSAENEYFTSSISSIDNQFEAWATNINMMSEASVLTDWLGIQTKS